MYYTTEPVDLCFEWAIARNRRGFLARMIRADKSRFLDAFFDEWSAALQFPPYFGFNWPAFDELLSDLNWLSPSPRSTIIIAQGQELLADEPEEMSTFLRIARTAIVDLARPLDQGNGWARAAVDLDLVFQVDDLNQLIQMLGSAAGERPEAALSLVEFPLDLG